jgi:hypothetical protein
VYNLPSYFNGGKHQMMYQPGYSNWNPSTSTLGETNRRANAVIFGNCSLCNRPYSPTFCPLPPVSNVHTTCKPGLETVKWHPSTEWKRAGIWLGTYVLSACKGRGPRIRVAPKTRVGTRTSTPRDGTATDSKEGRFLTSACT